VAVLLGIAMALFCMAVVIGLTGCRMVGNQEITIRLDGGGTVNVGPGPAGNLQEAGKEIGRNAKPTVDVGGL
jgi:hypothetical protein